MKKFIFLTFIIISLFAAITYDVYAAGSSGSNSGYILLLNPNAGVNALGNSGVGGKNPDWQFLEINPAFISAIENKCIGFSHNKYIASTDQQCITAINSIDNFKFALSISFFDYNDMLRTTYDNYANPESSFTAKDLIVSAIMPIISFDNIHSGIKLKYLSEKIDNYRANAAAVDLGIYYRKLDNPFSFGFSMLNAGTKMKFQSKKENLPLSLKLGCGFEVIENLNITADVEKIKSESPDLKCGVEYNFKKILALRAGYDGANDAAKGISLGIGMNIIDKLEIDYAYIPYNFFDNSHKFSLSYNFGKFEAIENNSDIAKRSGIINKIEKKLNYEEKIDFTVIKSDRPDFNIKKAIKYRALNKIIISDKTEYGNFINLIINKDSSYNKIEIEIADDSSFSSIFYNEITMQPEERVFLEFGTYYIRARFIDSENGFKSNWQKTTILYLPRN